MRISIAGSVPRSVLRTSWRTSSWTEWSRPRGDSGGHSRPNRQTWSALGRIAATNRDLPVSIAGGTFRSDLYYRFNVFPLEMPPLRDRKEDIPLLVEYFIGRYAKKAGKQIRSIARETLDRLTSYDWPGNVRELQNVIERSVIVCDRETVTVDESWLGRRSSDGAGAASRSFTDLRTSHERSTIEAALAYARGRVAGPLGAAERLGLPASTLESKIRTLGIDKRRFGVA